ncbi:hypothetical protein Tco_0039682 [Tanacetum coccineum]
MFTNLVNFSDMAPLPAADQRHPCSDTILRSTPRGLDIVTSRVLRRYRAGRLTRRGAVGVRESRLEETIWDLSTFGGVRKRMTCRQFILALGLHMEQEMAEVGFGAYWAGSDRLIPDKRDLSIDGGTTNVLHLLARYLFRHAEGRKSRARLLGGYFIGCLAMHFGLAWVASGPEMQQATAASAYKADEASPAAEEGAQEIPAPAQAPLLAPPAPQPWSMSQRIERIKEEVHNLLHSEALVNMLFAQGLILENYHEQNIRFQSGSHPREKSQSHLAQELHEASLNDVEVPAMFNDGNIGNPGKNSVNNNIDNVSNSGANEWENTNVQGMKSS